MVKFTLSVCYVCVSFSSSSFSFSLSFFLPSFLPLPQGLTDTKIVSSRFSPMPVLHAPPQTDFSQPYSQHSLHRSVSQLIDRKSLMMDEGSWENPLGQDSGLVRHAESFRDKHRLKAPWGQRARPDMWPLAVRSGRRLAVVLLTRWCDVVLSSSTWRRKSLWTP